MEFEVLNHVDDEGLTALHYAVRKSSLDVGIQITAAYYILYCIWIYHTVPYRCSVGTCIVLETCTLKRLTFISEQFGHTLSTCFLGYDGLFSEQFCVQIRMQVLSQRSRYHG